MHNLIAILRKSILKCRPTKRAPDAGDSAAISSSFLRLIIFLVGRLRRPRPSAGNANRWVLVIHNENKCGGKIFLMQVYGN